MKKDYSILTSCVLLLALATSLSSCSSSQTGDSEFGDDIPADAGTDAVPSEHAENAAPADGSQQDPNQAQASNGDQQQAQSADQQPQPHDQVGSADPQAQPSGTPDANSLAANTTPTTEPAPAVPPTTSQPEAVTPAPIADTSLTKSSTPETNTASSSGSGGSESYHVRHGDTLMRIAFEKYGDLYKWKQIYEANRDKIKDPNVIMPGTVLSLENTNNDLPAHTGKRYMIKHGDTLARISNDVYGTPRKWKKIWEHNKPWIPNPNRIFAGFYLYYTGGKNPEDIERHEEENTVTPMAQDNSTEQQAPREPASAVQEPVAATAPAPSTAK